MRKRYTLTAIVCLSGSLMLAGCDQSGADSGTATATATKASASKQADTAKSSEAASLTVNDMTENETTPPQNSDLTELKPGTQTIGKSKLAITNANARSTNARSMADASGTKLEGISTTPGQAAGNLTVRAEPASLDIGEVPTGDTGTGYVKLVNFGSDPVKLIECKSSCGCTAAKCPRNEVIDPGQSVEIEIKMKAGNRPTRLTKVMRFMFENQPQLMVSVSSEAVSYVMAEPWTINRDQDQEQGVEQGSVTLTSKDGEPFRVVRMHPPILEDFPQEPAATHEITFDWDRWKELNSSRRLTFFTDHPKCDKIFVNVQAIYQPKDLTNLTAKRPNQPQQVSGDNAQAGRLNAADGGGIPPAPADRIDMSKDPAYLLKSGKTDVLMKMIDDGEISVEHQDRTGASILAMAAQNGQLEAVNKLIELGADVESRDRIGKTPLMWAGHAKDVAVVRALLDAGADIRARDSVVGTALSWTAGFGDGESVRELIDAGSDVNVAGTMGFTPLVWASLTGEADSVTALLEAGADPEIKDMTPAGATPLMHAAQTGNIDNLNVLIEHGVKLEATDREGKTALLVAAEKSGADVEIVKALVKAGADVTATDRRGRTALDLARTRTDPRAAKVIEYFESMINTSGE